MIKDPSIEILSDITIFNKYAKYIPTENRRESWKEIVDRNKGMHLKKFPQLSDKIEKAYMHVYAKNVLPSMRSIQFAGKPIEINPTRIYNCAFLPIDDHRAFSEVMFLLLSGTGVGFSVQEHDIEKLPEIQLPNKTKKKRYLVGDSIEGWADAIKMLVKSYFTGRHSIDFDFSDIRAKGSRLITSGGKAPGPQPLMECILKIKGILDSKETGDKLKSIEVYDIICLIADAVLAGGIRRAALICLFSATDNEMIASKSGNWWELNPHRGRSNNSAVLVRSKIDEEFFFQLWERIKLSGSGEPGIYLTNDKSYGTNPCVEIALRAFQYCNLCEVNVSDVETQEELNDRVSAASFIGTLQASYTNFHYLREVWKRVTEKDALIGVGITGVGSGKVLKLNLKESAEIVKKVNAETAQLIGIKQAARTTTIKPAGTTSLVFGTSSGIHAWHAKYYIRRMRILKSDALYTFLKINNPELLEDDFFRPHDTAIISIPQKAPDGSILRSESALDLLNRVKTVYKSWVKPGHRGGMNTNNISTTVSVKPDEWDEVGKWMWENRNYYNGIAVLPYDGGTYVQAPFEDITEEEFELRYSHITNLDLTGVVEMEDKTDVSNELACAGGNCEII